MANTKGMQNKVMGSFEEREQHRKKSVIKSLIDFNPQQPEKAQQLNNAIIVFKEKEETRSKRVNLLLQPSVYVKAQTKCKDLGISLNECVNQFLNNWVKE
jgi:hypothetical protein